MARGVTYITALMTMLLVLLLLVSSCNRGAAAEEEAEDFPEFLFVQTASGAVLNGTLVLTGVSADTTYFADRPDRIAGSMLTADFMRFFDTGDDNFDDVRSALLLHVQHSQRPFKSLRATNCHGTSVLNVTVSHSLSAYVYVYVRACRILRMPPWCAGLMASRRQRHSSYRSPRCRLTRRTACRRLSMKHRF